MAKVRILKRIICDRQTYVPADEAEVSSAVASKLIAAECAELIDAGDDDEPVIKVSKSRRSRRALLEGDA